MRGFLHLLEVAWGRGIRTLSRRSGRIPFGMEYSALCREPAGPFQYAYPPFCDTTDGRAELGVSSGGLKDRANTGYGCTKGVFSMMSPLPCEFASEYRLSCEIRQTGSSLGDR